MKTVYVFVTCLLLSITISAQSFIDKNYSSYFEKEDVTRVTVGAKAFSMMHQFTKNSKDSEAQDISKIISKINSFDLLAIENVSDPQSAFKSGVAKLNGFEELVKVKNKEANVSIQIKESNGIISEIVGLVASDNEFVVFNLTGQIDMDEIGNIVSQIENKDLGKVFKGTNIDLGDIKMYPNPVKHGQKVSISVPENMQGGKATLYDVDGRKIRDFDINSNTIEVDTDKLKNSTHVIKFQKEGNMYTKKFVVTE
jgi:hypothetical protein